MAPRRFGSTARRFGTGPISGPPPGIKGAPPGVTGIPKGPPRPGQTGIGIGQPDNRFGPTGPLRFTSRTVESPEPGGRFGSIYKRPLSTLGAVFRVLGVGENIAVGVAKGAAEDISTLIDAPTWEKALAVVSPWAWIAAHAPDNFTEVKDAVKENKTYEQWILESQDPNSFLYENAFVIGLGLSVFGDPTTYLTFGATGASKVAGQKLLAAAYQSTGEEAKEAILTGVIKRTGESTTEYGNDFDKVLHRIHTVAERPYTVGDSMAWLRRADRGELPDLSDDVLERLGIKARGPVKRTLRKAFARGGQGVRFMGGEIPGSRAIAPAFGRAVGRAPGVPAERESFYSSFIKHVVPDAKLKAITDDMTRALAMSEFPAAMRYLTLVRSTALDDALEHFAIDKVRAAKLRPGTPYHVRAMAAINNIFDDVPAAVPKRHRANLFKPGHRPTGMYVSRLKEIRTNAYKTRDRILQDAEDMGFTESQIDDLRRSWDELVERTDDPVDVLARWQDHTMGKMAATEVIGQILQNPLLARPALEGADDLVRIEDDIAELNERIHRATQRLNEKGISNRARMARAQVLRGLQEKSAVLASNWNVTKRRVTEQKAGTTVMRSDFEDEVIPVNIPKSAPNIVVRKKGNWTGVFPDNPKDIRFYGPGLKIPSDKEIAQYPWMQFGRFSIDRKSGKVVLATPGMDHEDMMTAAGKFLSAKEIDERYLQGTMIFEGGKIARINFSAMIEDGTVVNLTADELGLTQARLEELQDIVMRDANDFFDTAVPRLDTAGIKVGGVFDETAARAAFHDNAVPYKWKGKKYFVPSQVAQALDEMRNPKLVDHEMRKYFRTINYTQNKWKILATSVNPRFHVMNLVGGMWNNMLGGVYNPGDYVEQATAMYRQRIARVDAESGIGKALAPVRGRINPEKLARDRELEEAFDIRGASGGFISHESHPRAEEMKRASRFATKKRKAFTATRRTYAAATVTGAIAPDEWIPDEIEDSPLFSPVAGLALGLPEISRAGRYLANDVETMLRQTPMRVAQKDPSLYQTLDALSVPPTVHFSRWLGEMDVGKTRAHQELIWDIGAAMAIRYQFDYSNLTNFERYVAKTVIPFYTFNKNNFVLQVQEVVNRPRFLATAADVMNYSTYATMTEDNDQFQAILPEYFDKLAMFRVPVPGALREAMGLPQDQDLFLNPTLPFASLNLFPPLWELQNDQSLTPTNNRLLQMLAPMFGLVGPHAVAPMFKPMIEYSVGVNLGLARPIDYQAMQSGGWRHSYREAPGFMHYLPKQLQQMFGAYKDPSTGMLMQDSGLAYLSEQMASPFINSSGDIFNWGQSGVESDRNRANNFAFITGIRLTPVDPLRLQRSFLYRAENFLEGKRADAKRRGEPFSREDQRFLTRIRAHLKGVEVEWDRKNEALYGGG